MALSWDEARLVVSCGELPDERERSKWPDDVIVCTLRPEEADDPETIETVRDFVFERTLQARHDRLEELLDPDAALPEPDVAEPPEGADSEVAEREARFLGHLRDSGASGEGTGDPDASGDPFAPGAWERGAWPDVAAGAGALLYVGHVN